MDVCRKHNISAKVSENGVKLDPRVKRTRRLLQDAFVVLLNTKPFDALTVQDIAAYAEVNRATFYAHFEDKYDLARYHVRETFHTLLSDKLPAAPTLTHANLRLLTLTVCAYLGEFMSHCAPVSQADDHMIMVLQVRLQIQATVTDWLARAPQPAPAAPPAMLPTMISWTIFGAAMEWGQAGLNCPPEQIADQVVAALDAGLQGVWVRVRG